MSLDLLALGLLGLFAAVGAVRGALAAGLGLAGVALAWTASLWLGPALSPALGRNLGVAWWVAAPVAGTVVFMGVYLLWSALAFVLRAVERERRDGAPRSGRDRLGGALFGAVSGLVVVVLVVWLALFADALRVAGGASWAPDVEDSGAARLTRVAVEAGVRASLGGDGPGSRAVARAAARPAETLEEVQSLVANPRMLALRDDAGFWNAVEQGDVVGAERRMSFTAIAYDGRLRGQLRDLGMISDEAAGNPALFQNEVAATLREIGPRLRALETDPELQRLSRDPTVQRLAASGDTLGLLRNADVRRLIDRVLSESDGGRPAKD
jgi:uncharacterized membrane protein required for colicin V production